MSRVDDLYERFERRFRGPRSTILERLMQYAPLLAIVEGRVDERNALDLGCGRGEWVELLKSRGWKARGIDANRCMVAEAAQYDIDVVLGNAIAYIGALPDQSVQLITAFHLVEHLPTEVLLMLLREMNRVVAKDGVIILETPNPENLTVGTSNFYLDPTHEKPLPPQLLRFFLEHSGNNRAAVIRLNGEEDPAVFSTLESAIRPLFFRAFDYAVIGIATSDASYGEAIDRFTAQVAQGSPVDLVGIRKFDEFLNARQEADRTSARQTAADLTAVIHESRDSVHQAVEAVYNTTLPIPTRLAAIEAEQRTQAVALDTLSKRFDAAESRSVALVAVSERIDGIEASISATAIATSGRIDESEAKITAALSAASNHIDEVQTGVAATWAQIQKSARLVELSLRQELAAARRNADSREFRHVAALEALRKTTHDATARADLNDVEQARVLMERRIAEATQQAIERTTAAFTTSTSWRVTAPLRSLSDVVARRRVVASQVVVALKATPAKRGALANRFVWNLGKRAVRLVPGLRTRVLQSLDRHDLLVHPLNDRPAHAVIEAPTPPRFIPFRTLEELDEATRLARMSPDTQVLYLQMVEAQTRSADQR